VDLAEFQGLALSDQHPFPIADFFGVASAELVSTADDEPAIDWEDTGRAWQQSVAPWKKRAKHALGRFLALAEGSDDQVLAFVRAFGVLQFTQNGVIHSLQLRRSGHTLHLNSYDQGPAKRPVPVTWYRDWSRYFAAIYRLALSAERGEGGNNADWEILGKPAYLPRSPRVSDAWNAVTHHCELLLQRCGVRPTLRTSPLAIVQSDRPRISLVGHGLWGVLAAHLFYAVTGGEHQAICCACGKSFSPKRHPQSGRRVYCPKCGKDSGWRHSNRLANRKHRAKHDPRGRAREPRAGSASDRKGHPR
jgi:hypothetical protein